MSKLLSEGVQLEGEGYRAPWPSGRGWSWVWGGSGGCRQGTRSCECAPLGDGGVEVGWLTKGGPACTFFSEAAKILKEGVFLVHFPESGEGGGGIRWCTRRH